MPGARALEVTSVDHGALGTGGYACASELPVVCIDAGVLGTVRLGAVCLGTLRLGLAGHPCDLVVRHGGPQRGLVGTSVDHVDPVVERSLDHLEREELVALLAQDPAQALDVGVIELAVSGRVAVGVDQSLALEEADLGDRHIGELLGEHGQHLADRQRFRSALGSAIHRFTHSVRAHAEAPRVPMTNTSRYLPTWICAPSRRV